jgi:hypothetical protein
MFDHIRDVICRDDVRVINNLPKDERTPDSFAPRTDYPIPTVARDTCGRQSLEPNAFFPGR